MHPVRKKNEFFNEMEIQTTFFPKIPSLVDLSDEKCCVDCMVDPHLSAKW